MYILFSTVMTCTPVYYSQSWLSLSCSYAVVHILFTYITLIIGNDSALICDFLRYLTNDEAQHEQSRHKHDPPNYPALLFHSKGLRVSAELVGHLRKGVRFRVWQSRGGQLQRSAGKEVLNDLLCRLMTAEWKYKSVRSKLSFWSRN